jgi:hypothetical protein
MIRGRFAKSLWSIIVSSVCLIVAIRVFEWKHVIASLQTIDFGQFTLRCAPLLISIYGIRALRWVVIAGLPFSVMAILETYLYVTASIALSMITPFQLGEAAKIKFSRSFSGLDIASGVPAFIVERIMDVIVLTMLFSATGLFRPDARWLALGLPTTIILLLIVWLAPFITRRRRGGAGWLIYVERACIPGPRFLVATLLSIVSWSQTALLWNIALEIAGVTIPISGLITLLFGVTASVLASLTPSGIAVAELSIRTILMSYGVNSNNADTAAIVIRFLTILAVSIGALHAILLTFLTPYFGRKRLSTDLNTRS